ncbi:hypothetical protein MNBD_DELTA02-113, partial [hydrothermal vent metagenome]
CHEIVESFGGSIDVESELGKGTMFTVSFPLYKGEVLPGVGVDDSAEA